MRIFWKFFIGISSDHFEKIILNWKFLIFEISKHLLISIPNFEKYSNSEVFGRIRKFYHLNWKHQSTCTLVLLFGTFIFFGEVEIGLLTVDLSFVLPTTIPLFLQHNYIIEALYMKIMRAIQSCILMFNLALNLIV